MRLNAATVARTSAGPASGRGAVVSPRPRASAAAASRLIGRVTRRTASSTPIATNATDRPSEIRLGSAQLGGG